MKIINLVMLSVIALGLLVLASCSGFVPYDEVSKLNLKIGQLEAEKTGLMNEKLNLGKKVTDQEKQIADFKAQQGKDPSYDELIRFLAQDKTDELKDPNLPVNGPFMVAANAKAAGLRAYFLTTQVKAQLRIFIFAAFETERGIFCVNPYFGDKPMKVEIGRGLFQVNDMNPPAWDDMVVTITIFK